MRNREGIDAVNGLHRPSLRDLYALRFLRVSNSANRYEYRLRVTSINMKADSTY